MKNKILLKLKAFVNSRYTHFLINKLNFTYENKKFNFLMLISND